jgi:hypothetical protein
MILPGMILPSLCLCGAAKRTNGVQATKESRRLDLRFAISDFRFAILEFLSSQFKNPREN